MRYLVQQGLEQEQQDFLGRGHYERRGDGELQRGHRNGYEQPRLKTAEGTVGSSFLRCATQRAPTARG